MTQMRLLELVLDTKGYMVKTRAWLRGLWLHGFEGARQAAAGLA